MSGPQTGCLPTYNSLTDKHLAGYFSNARIRRHLQRSGLISRSGRIIPEKEYQLNTRRKDHQRYVQECLACTIFRKVFDMERHHQLAKKSKLENSVRKERLLKMKVEKSRRSVEDARCMRWPHPPPGPRNRCGLHPLVAADPAGHSRLMSFTSHPTDHNRAPRPVVDYNGGHPSHQHPSKKPAFSKMTSCRPNTAPGNTQHPLRLQPLHICAAVESVPKTSTSKQMCHAREHGQQLASGGERSGLRFMSSGTGVSAYQLPVVNNYLIPVPPPPLQKGDKSANAARSGTSRRRQLRPMTVPNDVEQLLTKNSGGFPKPSLHSNASVTMVFLGKSVHLSHNDADYRDEIKVYQQHCGGENLCVYTGRLLKGETFQFISRRHRGFPFSLTFFVNGMQVERLSCCCEYRHQRRSRLGERHGYFRFLSVEGATPCCRCIVAMGLDRKPCPPKRKMEEDHEEKHVGSGGGGVCSEPSKSSVDQKSSKCSVLVILPDHEGIVATVEDKMETGQEYRKEERKKLSDRESEDSQEDASKYEYDEDSESDEKVNEEGQTGDQRNGVPVSSSDDKTQNLDNESESKTSSQEALQVSGSEKDESSGYSDSDSEDDEQDRRPAHSLSFIRTQYSSEDDGHAETMKDEGKEEYNIQRPSDNAAHAQYGNENGENKLLEMEENRKTFALGKEGVDEAEKAKAEDLTAKEVFEDCKPGQEEIPKATGNGPHVDSEPEPGDSCADEEDENVASTEGDATEGGAVLAELTRILDVQEAAEQVVREGQMAGGRQALEKEDFVAEGGDADTEDPGEVSRVQPKEDAVAVLQAQGQLVVEESAPEESTVAEADPKGKGTGKGMESGTEVAPGEQEGLMEETESEAARGEELSGRGALLGRAAGGVVSGQEEVAGEVAGGEEAVEEAPEEEAAGAMGPLVKEVARGTVPEAEEAMEEGALAGKGLVVGGVSEEEEAVEDASLTEEGIARIVSPEGEQAVEEAISEGEEVAEKPEALLETLVNMNVCTGEVFVKPNEFSQLKASGEELMEMGKAAIGAATSETGKASEVEEISLLRAEDTVEETVEPGKDPVSSQLGEITAMEEEEGSAEALWGGDPSRGSKAKSEGAMEEKPDGGEMGVSAEIARAESGGGAASPRELAAGLGARLQCAKEGGERGPTAEGLAAEAALPALGPRVCAVVGGAQVGGTEAGWGGQSRMGGEGSGRDGEGVAGGAVGCGQGLNQEAALGCEGRGPAGAGGQGEAESGTVCPVSPRPGEPPTAERSPSTPAPGNGGAELSGTGAAGDEGLRPDTRPQRAPRGLGAAGGQGGLREGAEQAGVGAEGQRPGLWESPRAGVSGCDWSSSGVSERGRERRGGGSPEGPGAAEAGERSCGPREDAVNPDAVVVSSVQPRDGEEALL